jgi:hypothetical protein
MSISSLSDRNVGHFLGVAYLSDVASAIGGTVSSSDQSLSTTVAGSVTDLIVAKIQRNRSESLDGDIVSLTVGNGNKDTVAQINNFKQFFTADNTNFTANLTLEIEIAPADDTTGNYPISGLVEVFISDGTFLNTNLVGQINITALLDAFKEYENSTTPALIILNRDVTISKIPTNLYISIRWVNIINNGAGNADLNIANLYATSISTYNIIPLVATVAGGGGIPTPAPPGL